MKIRMSDLYLTDECNLALYLKVYEAIVTKDYNYNSHELVHYAKTACFDSWNLYCKETFKRESTTKKLYQLTILATKLISHEGIKAYLSFTKKPQSILRKLNLFRAQELEFYVGNIILTYLLAGFDVEIAGETLNSPYSLIDSLLSSKQIELLKELIEIEKFMANGFEELVQNKKLTSEEAIDLACKIYILGKEIPDWKNYLCSYK